LKVIKAIDLTRKERFDKINKLVDICLHVVHGWDGEWHLFVYNILNIKAISSFILQYFVICFQSYSDFTIIDQLSKP